MYVITVFEFRVKLEAAIAELEQMGIPSSQLLAVPLIKKQQEQRFFNPLDTEGVSLFGATAFGTIFMLFGVIYGYVLTWGPILWGLIGFICGVVFGLLVDRSRYKIRQLIQKKFIASNADRIDVVLHIRCNRSQVEQVEQILWKYRAVGVGRLDRDGSQKQASPEEKARA